MVALICDNCCSRPASMEGLLGCRDGNGICQLFTCRESAASRLRTISIRFSDLVTSPLGALQCIFHSLYRTGH